MKRVTPKVFLVGESKLHQRGMQAYLDFIGTKWKPQSTYTVSDPETIVEFMGRLCYRSWEPGMNPNVTKIRKDSKEYIHNILKVKHGSVLEHPVTHWVFADVSRVFTHEIVRHRAGMAFSQESLRFVRLEDLGLWLPPEIEAHPEVVKLFEQTFKTLGELQKTLATTLKVDGKPFSEKKKLTSAMRRVAPIGLATTIGVTANMRALRHIVSMRTAASAEAEVREVIGQMMEVCRERWPAFFQDFTKADDGTWAAEFEKV